jgi:hypothetical protein
MLGPCSHELPRWLVRGHPERTICWRSCGIFGFMGHSLRPHPNIYQTRLQKLDHLNINSN